MKRKLSEALTFIIGDRDFALIYLGPSWVPARFRIDGEIYRVRNKVTVHSDLDKRGVEVHQWMALVALD